MSGQKILYDELYIVQDFFCFFCKKQAYYGKDVYKEACAGENKQNNAQK